MGPIVVASVRLPGPMPVTQALDDLGTPATGAHRFRARQGAARRVGAPKAVRTAAGRPPEAPDREVPARPIERVTLNNPENGFRMLRTRARGHRELVTVVGHAATVAPGEWIAASGDWVDDRTYGQQFRARSSHAAAPSSARALRNFSARG